MPPKKASSVKKKRAKKPGGKKRGAAPLTEEAICRDLFARVGNGNDRVTPEQFRELMKVVTPAAPAAVCDEIVAVADEDRGGDIDFGEFYDLLSGGYLGEKPSVLLEKYKAGLVRIEKAGGYDAYVEKLPAPAAATPEEAKEILHARLVDYLRRTADPKALFRSLFDLMNEKRDGFLDREQLEKMVRLVMPRCTPELAAAVVKSADHNESGDVDFEEFCAAVEAGSFGMTAEELQPLFQRALKKMKDQGVVPPPPPATEGGALDEAALRKGEEDMKKLQEAAAKRREQLKAEADEKKRQRLRSRLVDFYAKHNPDKVREADISKVVGTAMQRGITEDDLFRTLYKKYNLDEAGEPRQDFVDSDWDATSSDVDETQMSEEERRAYRLKQQQKAEYRLAKKEEALHKAAQAVIKKETKAERAMAKTARERFLEGWKSVETLLREGKEREEKAAMAAAEEKLQRNEDVYHRGLNRKVWLRALDEAKQQLFEEKCVKNDAKRVYKRLKRKVYQHRAELKVTKATLDDLRNRQVAWVQNIRLAETLLEGQEELNASMRPPQDEFDANRAAAAALEQEIGELQEQIAKLRIDRNDYTLMHAAHRQYRLTLEEVVAGLEAELEEREASIDIFRDECIESVDELRAGSAADLEGLREKFNAELEKLQREVQRSEELRSEDKHYQDTRARGIRHNIVVYTEQCSDEIATLEQRLLELYPSVLRDLASSVGKASIHGVPVPSIDGPASGAARQPLIYTSQKQQPLAEHVVAALSVYKPRDMYVMSGAALPDEYSVKKKKVAEDEEAPKKASAKKGKAEAAPAKSPAKSPRKPKMTDEEKIMAAVSPKVAAAPAPKKKTKRADENEDEDEPKAKKQKKDGEKLTTKEFMEKHDIVVKCGEAIEPYQTFDCVKQYTNDSIQKAFVKAGFKAPSCIQSVCWPPALAGKDLIAVAKTGSGKTLGFLIPAYRVILSHMPKDPRQPRCKPGAPPVALVMSPTRELTLQIHEESVKFGNSSRIVTVAVYGGMPSGKQIRELRKGCHLVVATPGRLADLLDLDNPPVTNLNCIEYAVLDEADQMLDMGFEPQITALMNKLPPVHQTLMFTATWPKAIRKIADKFLRNAAQVQVGGEGLKANSAITQTIIKIDESEKETRLVQELVKYQKESPSTLVFTNRKSACWGLEKAIKRGGMTVVSLHGDLDQWQRLEALKEFKTGKAQIVVATDVAARGLDIDGVGLVVNYDFPPSGCENWVHRVGRTGRAGKTGQAITFFDPYGPEKKYADEFHELLTNSGTPIPEWLPPLAAKATNDNWYADQKKAYWSGRGGGWGKGGGKKGGGKKGGKGGKGGKGKGNRW